MSNNERGKPKTALLTLAEVAVVTTKASSVKTRKAQCSICLEDNVPRGNLSKETMQKFRIKRWMMVCKGCVAEITREDFINTEKGKGFDPIPFRHGESIDESSIFFFRNRFCGFVCLFLPFCYQ